MWGSTQESRQLKPAGECKDHPREMWKGYLWWHQMLHYLFLTFWNISSRLEAWQISVSRHRGSSLVYDCKYHRWYGELSMIECHSLWIYAKGKGTGYRFISKPQGTPHRESKQNEDAADIVKRKPLKAWWEVCAMIGGVEADNFKRRPRIIGEGSTYYKDQTIEH